MPLSDRVIGHRCHGLRPQAVFYKDHDAPWDHHFDVRAVLRTSGGRLARR
jgi:hypothetical protein